jgi:hypothetical protein
MARRCSCLSIARATSRACQALLPAALPRRRLAQHAACHQPSAADLRATRIEAVPIEPLPARILPRRRAARVLGKRRPRAPTPRGSGCSGIGRGVGFAYMTVPVGQRAPAQSAPNSLGLPPSLCSLSHCASAEKKVTPGFDDCGSDTSEAKLAAGIPFSAILMISWNRCFHES